MVLYLRGTRHHERAEQPNAPLPNIALIVLDTVRSDAVGPCGETRPVTPALDRLVQMGATVRCDAYAPGSWTLPTHASYFTGLAVPEHGADFTAAGAEGCVDLWEEGNAVSVLAPEARTLAEELGELGYRTVGLSANPLLNEQMGLTQGFDRFRAASAFGGLHGPRFAAALRELDARLEMDGSEPHSLFLNIADAHQPWPRIAEGHPWLPPREGIITYFVGGKSSIFDRLARGQMPERERQDLFPRIRDLYAQAVQHADNNLDAAIHLLMQPRWLKRGLRIVVVSDHGEFLGEHGLIDHGLYLWQANSRVPLLVWDSRGSVDLPGLCSATLVHSLVREAAGLPDRRPDEVVAHAYPGNGWSAHSDGRLGTSRSVAIWENGNKYLWMDGVSQTFDLRDDPGEQRGSPVQDAERRRRLDELARLDSGRAAPLSEEAIKVLRSSGYVQ